MCFEVPSSTEWQPPSSKISFMPNWFVNVSGKYMEKKISALKIYEGEMREWPHSRSYKAVESLACWRGASVGVSAAESFVLARNLES